MNLQELLAQAASAVNEELDRLLPRPSGAHGRVQAAMRYAVTVGGKRLPPVFDPAGRGAVWRSPDRCAAHRCGD